MTRKKKRQPRRQSPQQWQVMHRFGHIIKIYYYRLLKDWKSQFWWLLSTCAQLTLTASNYFSFLPLSFDGIFFSPPLVCWRVFTGFYGLALRSYALSSLDSIVDLVNLFSWILCCAHFRWPSIAALVRCLFSSLYFAFFFSFQGNETFFFSRSRAPSQVAVVYVAIICRTHNDLIKRNASFYSHIFHFVMHKKQSKKNEMCSR